MFKIFHNVDGDKITVLKNDAEFVHFMRTIAVENCDEELSITCKGEALDYLNEYCESLTLIPSDAPIKRVEKTNLKRAVYFSPQTGATQFERYVIDSVETLEKFLNAFPKMKSFRGFKDSALKSLALKQILILTDPNPLTKLNTYCFEKQTETKAHPSDFIRVKADC